MSSRIGPHRKPKFSIPGTVRDSFKTQRIFYYRDKTQTNPIR